MVFFLTPTRCITDILFPSRQALNDSCQEYQVYALFLNVRSYTCFAKFTRFFLPPVMVTRPLGRNPTPRRNSTIPLVPSLGSLY